MKDQQNFPPVSKQEWLAKIEKDLRGKALADLSWHLGTHLEIDPFAHSDDLTETPAPILAGRKSNDWEIGESIQVKDPSEANQLLLRGLENGVKAPLLLLESVQSPKALSELFEAVELSFVSTHFAGLSSDAEWQAQLTAWKDFLSNRGVDFKQVNSSFAAPASAQLLQSDIPKNWKVVEVDGTGFHRGPEQVVEELASLLQAGVAALATTLEDDVPLETAFKGMQFSISIGTSYFVEIAKIRAFHLLWANIQKAYKRCFRKASGRWSGIFLRMPCNRSQTTI